MKNNWKPIPANCDKDLKSLWMAIIDTLLTLFIHACFQNEREKKITCDIISQNSNRKALSDASFVRSRRDVMKWSASNEQGTHITHRNLHFGNATRKAIDLFVSWPPTKVSGPPHSRIVATHCFLIFWCVPHLAIKNHGKRDPNVSQRSVTKQSRENIVCEFIKFIKSRADRLSVNIFGREEGSIKTKSTSAARPDQSAALQIVSWPWQQNSLLGLFRLLLSRYWGLHFSGNFSRGIPNGRQTLHVWYWGSIIELIGR